MRVAPALALVAVLAGCSSGPARPQVSPNVAAWKPGQAVVVLVADLAPGSAGDFSHLAQRPGVVAVSSSHGTLRLSLSRQAMLADMVALRLELERTPGVRDVREVVVPPA